MDREKLLGKTSGGMVKFQKVEQRQDPKAPVVTHPSGGIKRLLLWFFIVEHLVVLLFFITIAVFSIRAYAFSPFSELDAKARAFQPPAQRQLVERPPAQLEQQLQRQM